MTVLTAEPESPPRRPFLRTPRGAWTAAAVLAVLVAGAVYLLAFSPVFGVRRVVVRGLHLVHAADVRAAAAIPRGTPLLRVDTAAVTQRVEALPDVASATVSTSFPSTVTVTVTERTAVGYVLSGTSAVLVDRTGRQYHTVAVAPRDLPRFDLPGDGPSDDEQAAGRALAATAAELPRDLLARIARIQALDARSITLVLLDGRTVLWGDATRGAQKATLLPALLGRPGTRIDLSDPEQVVVR